MLKVDPHPDYPPEEGCYIRGNDRSPVAVCIILKWDQEKVPPEIEELVRVGAESGAALSGTLQTENIGLEKIICNIVSNPNIRYFVLGGPESEGHLTGDAVKALFEKGVDDRKRIVGTESPPPPPGLRKGLAPRGAAVPHGENYSTARKSTPQRRKEESPSVSDVAGQPSPPTTSRPSRREGCEGRDRRPASRRPAPGPSPRRRTRLPARRPKDIRCLALGPGC